MKSEHHKIPHQRAEPSRMARRNRPKKEKPRWRRIMGRVGKVLIILLLVIIILTSIAGGVFWFKYGDVIRNSVTKGFEIAKTIDESDFVTKPPTVVYDKDGNVIKEFMQYEYETTEYEDMNPYFIEGTIAVEDKRFWIHHGVDLFGTIRSIVSTFIGGDVQGGSTITQQLVRNVILKNHEVTIERKLMEQVVAQELEKIMSKEEILRHYLNNVYFGNGNYGIGPASRYYFGKDQKELTAEECAVIIGITNNPTLFDPITQPKNALKKRNRILKIWLDEGILSQEEYDTAIKKPIELNIQKHHLDNRIHNDYALSFAIHKATEALMKKEGFRFEYLFKTKEQQQEYKSRYQETYERIRQNIVRGGYEIYTTIDPNIQKSLEETVEKNLQSFTEKRDDGFYKTQIAVTTIDNETGEVLAIVGGRSEEGDYLNRAYQSPRQPGSTAKPIVVYANAFEEGYRPESMVVDAPIKNGPRNWYNGYWGSLTLRYAVEQSVNTIPYKIAKELGTNVFMKKLEQMKFSHLTPEDFNPIISLGGFTYGATTVEMASAYATLARGGDFIEPTNIKSIKHIVTGETLVENNHERIPVWREDASYFTIDVLKGVITKGTGKRAKIPNYPHAFGKTGTTSDNRDSYFVGGTPYYTTAVWVGYDTPEPLSSSERTIPQDVFKSWNTELHKTKEIIDFTRPDSVYEISGNLYSRIESYDERQTKRKAQEDERMRKEYEWQVERLAKEDYRIIYGLTSEEEHRREQKTAEAIEKARNFRMETPEDYDAWVKLIEEAERLNEDVKHQAAKDTFTVQINELKTMAIAQRQALIEEMERQKKEERKREEARRKEEAEIAELQQELDRFMNRIHAGEVLTEEEFRELEQILSKLKNKGVKVPEIQVEWVEPETEEETENSSNETELPVDNHQETPNEADEGADS